MLRRNHVRYAIASGLASSQRFSVGAPGNLSLTYNKTGNSKGKSEKDESEVSRNSFHARPRFNQTSATQTC